MRDTRKLREAMVLFLVGGLTAVIGSVYLKPILKNNLGVK